MLFRSTVTVCGAGTPACRAETRLGAFPNRREVFQGEPTDWHAGVLPPSATSPSPRRVAFHHVAPARQLAPCDVSPARQALSRQSVRLDESSARSGPLFLAQERIANIVAESLHRGALLGHYELGAYAIMANHVHVLLLPRISPSRLLQSLKGTTGRLANRLLGRTGETFWQAENTGCETNTNGTALSTTLRAIQ